MYQRILVATDDSSLSRKAVKTAIGLAAPLQAELVVLHVVPRYPTDFFQGAIAIEPEDIARIEGQWADKGQSVADAAVRAAQAAGVRARGVVAQSDAVADAILSAAKKHRCDLVVMASHGRRGLQRLLLGSETQHVLTRGNLPVLVLR
ncbi:universal stress protein [Ramlibacter tataouinensis]|uniref:universal stress protein n=1 Tax=Ramlibacter tataouinensis TaxID=94132 RepID=UPI0022F3E6BA|nr:universal stress protein [Ramlibacter tataouinensis]WBY02492.1 universal stress protein [Ramlibacter tataouinensis]